MKTEIGWRYSMLTVKNLSKRYHNGVQALNDINLSIGKGMYGLLGPNGAGKSSLMRTLATLQSPDSGEIHFHDLDVIKDPQSLRKSLGYLPQEFGVYPRVSAYKLLDYLAVLKGIQDKKTRYQKVLMLLERTNLLAHKDKAVANFSGGMVRRFGIAQALISSPDLIIVDEPTAGLDPQERNRFYSLLSEVSAQTTLILSTHIIEDIQGLCDQMAIIDQGEIISQGSTQKLTQSLQGKVWQTLVDEAKASPIFKKNQVLSIKSIGVKRQFRVLSAQQPGPEFTLAEPDLEDVYFSVLNIKQSQ